MSDIYRDCVARAPSPLLATRIIEENLALRPIGFDRLIADHPDILRNLVDVDGRNRYLWSIQGRIIELFRNNLDIESMPENAIDNMTWQVTDAIGKILANQDPMIIARAMAANVDQWLSDLDIQFTHFMSAYLSIDHQRQLIDAENYGLTQSQLTIWCLHFYMTLVARVNAII